MGYKTLPDINVVIDEITANIPQLPIALGSTTKAGSLSVTLASDQGNIPVTVSGGATSAKQDTGNTSLASIDSKLSGSLSVSGTVAVSSSALPTGAATEATLSAQSAKLPATLGRKAMAASLAVTIASDQGTFPVSATIAGPLGQTTDNASIPVVIANNQSAIPVTLGSTDFGAAGAAVRVAALLGNAAGAVDYNTGAAGAQTLRTVLAARSEAAATPLSARLTDGSAFYQAPTTGQIPTTLGQKAMASSLAVTLASDQSAVPASQSGSWSIANITGTVSLPTGAATESTLSAQSAKLPATLGQKAMTASLAVALASDQSAIPVTQSGTWNINNISGTVSLPTGAATETTLAAQSAKLPATIGQKAMAASLAVTMASDQSAIPASQSGTWNITNVSGTVSLPTGAATETTLAAASAKLPATLGQKAMAASMAVTIASDQSAVPASQSGTWNITNVSGTVSLPTGAATETTLAAQSAKLPAALGSTTKAGSLSIALASDQTIPHELGLSATPITRDFSSVNATSAFSNLGSALGANTYKGITVFDSGGGGTSLAYVLGWDSTDQLYIPAGGHDGFIPLAIPASKQLQIRTIVGTVSTGFLHINCMY